jgi:hypothetical protein
LRGGGVPPARTTRIEGCRFAALAMFSSFSLLSGDNLD